MKPHHRLRRPLPRSMPSDRSRSHSNEAGESVSHVLRYRLMEPGADSSGETSPVLLFLHGAAERGRDNRQQLQGLPTRMALDVCGSGSHVS